jgi:cysteine-rich repeat protein
MRVKTHAHLFLKGSMIHEKPVSIIDKHSFFKRIFFTLSVLLLPFLLKATPGLFDFLAAGQGAQQGLPSVIIFYEPDCAHCRKMSSQLQEAAGFDKALQRRFYVELADITTVKGKELARKFNIHSVPAIVQSGIGTGKYNTINGFPGVDNLAGLLQVNYKLPATLDQQHAVAGGAPQCGNGALELGEQCDDANTTNGDGCSVTCQLEAVPKGVAINETGQLPDISSILDVSSTKKGLLIPRVANNEMQNIISPANGLLVYNTDSACFAYRNATAWVFLKGNGTASNDWSTIGNAGTDANTHFIGTTDDVNLIFKRNNIRAGLISFNNISLGEQALNPATTGLFNIAFGEKAMASNTTGNLNTATGYSALKFNTEGSSNTANGMQALSENTTGYYNTAMGVVSLTSNISGRDNVAIGAFSLFSNTDRNDLVALGNYALYNNGAGATQSFEAAKNTAIGKSALYSNTIGYNNTANGYNSLYGNVDGQGNTATGNESLLSNVSGNFNTAVGEGCLKNSNSSHNTAIGQQALNATTDGVGNTAVGSRAGLSATSGSGNVFIGYSAGSAETGSNKLYISNNNTNAANTLLYGEFDNKILSVGGRLGIGNTTPHGDLHLPQTLANRKIVLLEDVDNDHQFNGFGINTFIMRYQAAATTSSHVFYAGTGANTSSELMRITGNGEVGIGKIPFTTSDDSRLQIKQKGVQNGIGIEAANSTNHWDFYATSDVSSYFNLYYNGALKGTFDHVTGAYTSSSDRRLKKDITQQQPVLNNVMQLQAYQYHYLDNQPTDRFSNGFMAQDVQKIFPDAVVENTMKNGETRLGINYQYFTVLAIKGLQELADQNAKLAEHVGGQQKIIETQTNNIQQQEERIAKLEAAIKTLRPKN